MTGLQPRHLKRLNLVRLVGFIGIVITILLVVTRVENMLLSSILAFVISYLLGPWVNYLERAGVNRLLATVTSFAAIGGVIALVFTLTLPLISEQLLTFRVELPKYVAGTTELISDLESKIESLTGSFYIVDVSAHVGSALEPWTRALFEDLPRFVTKSITVMFLAPFLAFFMVKDGRQTSRSLLSLVPNSIFEPTINLFHQINDQMGHFVRARLLEAIIVGFVTWLGLFILNFPFASLLALFAALTNLIPYVGPLIGAVPAIIIAMINGESALGITLVICVYLIAQLIDAAFIIPVVVAKIVDLHPVTVVVAIIAGAQLLGVVGMLISIPVASVLKVTLGTVYRHLTDFRG